MTNGLTKQGQALYEKLAKEGNPDKRKIHIPEYTQYNITKYIVIKGYTISFPGKIWVDENHLFPQEEDSDFTPGNVRRKFETCDDAGLGVNRMAS